jgi:hypothetical protein
MHFDGVLAGAEVAGNLLVELAGNDMFHHLALARREACEPLLELGHFGRPFVLFGSALQRSSHGTQEVGIVDRLGEEIHRAGLDSLHAHRDVAVPGEKHDRQQYAGVREPLLEVQTVEFRHRDIEHQTTQHVRLIRLEEGFGRVEGVRGEALGLEQARERLEHPRFVVQDENCLSWGHEVISNQ